MARATARAENPPLIVRLHPVIKLDEEQLFDLCRLNRDLRIEQTAEGDLEIMPPTGGGMGKRNFKLNALLGAWALQDGTGEGFDTSSGFILPNGATRSPDAAWIRKQRLAALAPDQWERFLPLCPDFVVELRSPSDRLELVQAKMQEYIPNGASLGWLLDSADRRVHVYRPGAPVEMLDGPAQVSAEPELPGFILNLHLVWGGKP